VRPNIFLGRVLGSAQYQKWYFEVTLDHMEQTTHMMPHLRIGWANTAGYIPYPGGGEKWGGNGVGDDLYSFSFDGANLWTGKLFFLNPAISILIRKMTCRWSQHCRHYRNDRALHQKGRRNRRGDGPHHSLHFFHIQRCQGQGLIQKL